MPAQINAHVHIKVQSKDFSIYFGNKKQIVSRKRCHFGPLHLRITLS